ncbi:MAG: porin family protein [Leptolyngbyaceae cyanobacterium RU_5_1]|nr:porin family protein [Leptolyngbyaceae cyanobacterium RU_5_1]
MDQQVAYLRSSGLVAIGSIALAAGFTLSTPSSVRAQAAYGSYIGAGAAFGVSDQNPINEDRNTSAFFGVRYKFLKAPISLRAQVLVGGEGVAVVPTVSYDFPINWQADVYVGAGASIVRGDKTPIGNKGSFVIQPGIDYALPNSNLMLFGNAIISFDGYRSNNGTAASIQAGAGLRF